MAIGTIAGVSIATILKIASLLVGAAGVGRRAATGRAQLHQQASANLFGGSPDQFPQEDREPIQRQPGAGFDFRQLAGLLGQSRDGGQSGFGVGTEGSGGGLEMSLEDLLRMRGG